MKETKKQGQQGKASFFLGIVKITHHPPPHLGKVQKKDFFWEEVFPKTNKMPSAKTRSEK